MDDEITYSILENEQIMTLREVVCTVGITAVLELSLHILVQETRTQNLNVCTNLQITPSKLWNISSNLHSKNIHVYTRASVGLKNVLLYISRRIS
jgi:hypothetical protein